MKIKIDPADRYFSYYVRELSDWTCARCHTKYPRKSQGLHCSHFFGRRAESTRFDPENACSHCFSCHQYLGSNPLEFVEWKKKQLGEKRFQALTVQHNMMKKKDRKLEAMIWKQALKELCEKKGVDYSIFK
jgi:hypothetical protein